MSAADGAQRGGATPGDPALTAVVSVVAEASRADAGWLVALDGASLRVVAAVGDDVATVLGNNLDAGAGTAGYVIASGQPLALSGGDDARLGDGVAALLGRRPRSVLCVPCVADDRVLGAIEIVDKAEGARFTFDDVELATLLAEVAAAILATGAVAAPVPTPAELAGDLQRLAEADVARYRAVAIVVSDLIAHG